MRPGARSGVLLVGEQIGDWLIEGPPIEGGTALLHPARHTGDGRRGAVKVARADAADRELAAARIRREGDALARVDHPGVVQLLARGRDPASGAELLVLEWVEGETLATRLGRDGALPAATAVAVTGAVLDALAAIHAAGLVHGDLSAGNVILGARVTLVDLGLAAAPGDGVSDACAGTPAYASPEQLQGLQTDCRSDIYSAGVILHEMLTGSRPFQADSAADLASLHLDAPPPRPSATRPSLARFDELVLACLAKAPEARPESAAAMRAWLSWAASGADAQGPASLEVRVEAYPGPDVDADPDRTVLALASFHAEVASALTAAGLTPVVASSTTSLLRRSRAGAALDVIERAALALIDARPGGVACGVAIADRLPPTPAPGQLLELLGGDGLGRAERRR